MNDRFWTLKLRLLFKKMSLPNGVSVIEQINTLKKPISQRSCT